MSSWRIFLRGICRISKNFTSRISFCYGLLALLCTWQPMTLVRICVFIRTDLVLISMTL